MAKIASIYFESDALYDEYEQTLPHNRTVSQGINELIKADIEKKKRLVTTTTNTDPVVDKTPVGHLVDYDNDNNSSKMKADPVAIQDSLDAWIPEFHKLDDLETVAKLEGRFRTGDRLLVKQYMKIRTSREEVEQEV